MLDILMRVHECFDRDELIEIAEQIHYPPHLYACSNLRQLKNQLSLAISPLVECS